MRVLVCGGRNFDCYHATEWALDELNPSVLIEGGATGADEHARIYAAGNNIELLTFKADWNRYGRVAGPIRNKQMIDEGRPECVLAMPGGRGTADMVRRAVEAGIHVIEVRQEVVAGIAAKIKASTSDQVETTPDGLPEYS
jgi:hypothetical protein